MLPKFQNEQEKKEYAKKLHNLFLQDPRVTKMIADKVDKADKAKKDKPLTIKSTNWPDDAVTSELNKKINMPVPERFSTGAPPRSVMGNFLDRSRLLLLSLENIIDPSFTGENLNIYMNQVEECITFFQAPDKKKPLETLQNYFDAYGKKDAGKPIMEFFAGVSQTISNITIANQMLCEEPAAVSNQEKETEVMQKQEEIEKEEDELAKLCAQHGVAYDKIDEEYIQSTKDAANVDLDITNAVDNASKNEQQIAGLNAEDELNKLQKMNSDRNVLKEALKNEKNDLKLFEQEVTKWLPKKLDELKTQADDIKYYQEDLDQKMQNVENAIKQARPQKLALEQELQKHYADHPGLSELDDKYDKISVKARDLASALDDIIEVFGWLPDDNVQINNFLSTLGDLNDPEAFEKKLTESGLDRTSCKAATTYFEKKKEITELLKGDMDEKELAEIFAQAEQSKEKNAGELLTMDGSSLWQQVQKYNQELDKMDANPDLKTEIDLKRKIAAQNKIINTNTALLESQKQEQNNLNKNREYLKQKENAFKNACIEKATQCHAFSKGVTGESMAKLPMEQVAKQMKSLLKDKSTEVAQRLKKLKSLSEEHRAQKQTVNKIKVSKESAKNLVSLNEKKQQVQNRTKTLENLSDRKRDITDKLTQREHGIREIKTANAVRDESKKRGHLLGMMASLSRQIPINNGEKNSEYYSDMQQKMRNLILSFGDSSFTTQNRLESLNQMKKSAQTYLDMKNDQWRPFPSQKRNDRKKAAQDIISFCNTVAELYKDIPALDPEILREVARQPEQVSPADLAKLKFTEEMMPKAEKANKALQKQPDELSKPGTEKKQEQLNQNQTQINTSVSHIG